MQKQSSELECNIVNFLSTLFGTTKIHFQLSLIRYEKIKNVFSRLLFPNFRRNETRNFSHFRLQVASDKNAINFWLIPKRWQAVLIGKGGGDCGLSHVRFHFCSMEIN